MLSFNNLKRKIALTASFVALVATSASSVGAQDAHEHVHRAEAVLAQKMEFNVNDGSVSMTLNTATGQLVFNLEENSKLTENAVGDLDQVTLYKGKIEGIDNSWVRLSRVQGKVKGAFYDGRDLFFVEDYEDIAKNIDAGVVSGMQHNFHDADQAQSVVINAKDISSTGTCALHDHGAENLFDYNNFVDDLVQMSGQGATKQLKISLVADTEFVSSTSTPTADMLNLLNVADGIFSEQVGVELKLTKATELTNNGSLTSTNASTLINAFRNFGNDNPGVSHLFTNKNLQGSTVGIAYVGSLCRQSSVGITQKLGSKTAIVFTHELGHNFGAPHDNQSGSACSSTPSGFVMNPNVNGGSTTFSQCSIDRMQSTIGYALTGMNACMVELDAIAPEISSTPNTSATAGQDYSYVVEASGSGRLDFELEIAPQGMTLSDSGVLTWIPSANDEGANTVQIRVSNSVGDDLQVFDVIVESAGTQQYINFNETSLSSYGLEYSQDVSGEAAISNSGYQLTLRGNTWKRIPIDYVVTKDTILEFNFVSNSEGEIHGIALDNDDKESKEFTFQVYGSQSWGYRADGYFGSGNVQTISIPVGEFFQGKFSRLGFIMDNDVERSQAESIFSDVIIYERGQKIAPRLPAPNVLDFNLLNIKDHLPNEQDFVGSVDVIENGTGIELSGNKWQKVVLSEQAIERDTVISFEFKTDKLGEIHGIGIFDGDFVDPDVTFQVAGTQEWANNLFDYTGNGDWQEFTIPLGQFLRADSASLVFIMDDDVNSAGISSFRNIHFSSSN